MFFGGIDSRIVGVVGRVRGKYVRSSKGFFSTEGCACLGFVEV